MNIAAWVQSTSHSRTPANSQSAGQQELQGPGPCVCPKRKMLNFIVAMCPLNIELKDKLEVMTRERDLLQRENMKYKEVIPYLKTQLENLNTYSYHDFCKALSGYFSQSQIDFNVKSKPIKTWKDQVISKTVTLRT